ncbi:MAG: rhodanese-like domain-containing protein [Planctomycetota bacterium]
MRDLHPNLGSPAKPRGAFLWLRLGVGASAFVAFCVLLAALAMTRPAMGEVFVTTEQLAQRIAAEAQRTQDTGDGDWHDAVRPLVIVHVGHGRRGYDRGHIPGAIYVEGRETYAERDGIKTVLPTPEDFAVRLGQHGLGPGTDLLLYGDAAGVFPARMYAGLSMLGLDENARLLDGHLREWLAQERAVSTESSAREPITFDVRARPAWFPNGAQIVDSRSTDAFAGDKAIPGTDARGHLPNSVNLPWRTLIPDIKRPTLVLDASERLREALGPSRLRSFVVLDDRGNGSAVLFAILRHSMYSVDWDDRGLGGRAMDGEAFVKSDAPNP